MATREELKKQVLFEGLSDDMLDVIAAGCREITLKKGDSLFREKEDAKGVYLIRSGKVEISKKTDDGWKQRLVIFSANHFFGELSIMERREHEADATALEDARLFLMPKDFFNSLEKDNIQIAHQIIKKIAVVMSNNLREMNSKFVKALISY